MAMPLSEELWRPISCSRRERVGLEEAALVGSLAPPPRATGSFSSTSSGTLLAPDWLAASAGAVLEVGSAHMAKRLPMLLSDWLVSEVSEDPEMLRSSPATEVL